VATSYRTVSTNALHVITGVPPIKLIAEERKSAYKAKKQNRDLVLAREIAKKRGQET